MAEPVFTITVFFLPKKRDKGDGPLCPAFHKRGPAAKFVQQGLFLYLRGSFSALFAI